MPPTGNTSPVIAVMVAGAFEMVPNVPATSSSVAGVVGRRQSYVSAVDTADWTLSRNVYTMTPVGRVTPNWRNMMSARSTNRSNRIGTPSTHRVRSVAGHWSIRALVESRNTRIRVWIQVPTRGRTMRWNAADATVDCARATDH